MLSSRIVRAKSPLPSSRREIVSSQIDTPASRSRRRFGFGVMLAAPWCGRGLAGQGLEWGDTIGQPRDVDRAAAADQHLDVLLDVAGGDVRPSRDASVARPAPAERATRASGRRGPLPARAVARSRPRTEPQDAADRDARTGRLLHDDQRDGVAGRAPQDDPSAAIGAMAAERSDVSAGRIQVHHPAGHSSTSGTSVRARSVSCTSPTTVTGFQRIGGMLAGSVTPIALLAPGIAVVAVSGALPEPGLIA